MKSNFKLFILSMIFFISYFSSCTPKEYVIDSTFSDMRKMAFSVQPDELNIQKEYDNQIYAVFMETGYEDAVISLFCFVEGSISLYFSSGGGMIGIGEHLEARNSGLTLIDESEKYINLFESVNEYPLPANGKTIFYLLTFDGIYSYIENVNILGNNQSEISPLFYDAQDVITQARLIHENN